MKWIYREILHDAEVYHVFFPTLEDATRECERAIAENKVVSGPFEVSDSYILNEANGALARMRDVWDGKLFRGAKVKIKAPGQEGLSNQPFRSGQIQMDRHGQRLLRYGSP